MVKLFQNCIRSCRQRQAAVSLNYKDPLILTEHSLKIWEQLSADHWGRLTDGKLYPGGNRQAVQIARGHYRQTIESDTGVRISDNRKKQRSKTNESQKLKKKSTVGHKEISTK